MEPSPENRMGAVSTVAWALIFISASFILYLNTLKAPVIWDDITLLADNKPLRDISVIGRVFIDPKLFSHEPGGAMFRPITLASFVVNYAVAGWNPIGLRIVNIVLHAFNAILLMFLLESLLTGSMRNHFYTAVPVAMVWLANPAHTEAVDHVSSRSVLLVTFFYLAATLLFIKWKRRSSNSRMGFGTPLCFALALMSKEIAITFPVMTLLVDALTPGEHRKTWPVHIANFAVAGGYFGLRAIMFEAPLGGNYVRPVGVNALTQSRVVLYYMSEIFFPFRLNVNPDFSVSTSLSDPRALAAVLIIAALLMAAFLYRSKSPLISLAVFWYFLALAPTSFIPLKRIVNEHNIYLPSIGCAILLSLIYSRLRHFKPKLLLGLFILMAISFGSLTITRNRAWQSEENLWRAAVRFSPHAVLPRVHLGNIYYNSGRFSSGTSIYRTLSMDEPQSAVFRYRLGIGLFETAQYDEAAKALREAIRLDPKLADAYEYLGHVYLSAGKPREAVEAYQTVKTRGLSTSTISHNLSHALSALGKSIQTQSGCESALSYYRQSVNEDPTNTEAQTLLQNCQIANSP